VLLDGVIDYAGLFPPAAVSLPEAVRQYTRYRGGEQGWMLGRFVCPVGALSDFTRTAEPFLPRDAGALPWRLTVVGSGDHRADQDAVDRFNAHHRWSADDCSAVIDAIETRLVSVSEVGEAHGVFRDALTVYGELPLDDALPSLVAALASHGMRAKLRAGGVTAGAFPSGSAVARFITTCVAASVPFKATAGLHHAVCGTHPLTYAPDAPTAPMFGFLNMLLATASAMAGAAHAEIEALLTSTDLATLHFHDEEVAWGEHLWSTAALAEVRTRGMVSFGSCSFTEPTEEALALGVE
jgi:hypothetical protein